MTANQIEYWKLQENKRHNLVTEGYEGAYKKAQTQYTYASMDLIGAQIATEGTKQALNLASAGAQQSAAALNYERINTELTQQEYNNAMRDYTKANEGYVDARTEGQYLQNRIDNPNAILGDERSTVWSNNNNALTNVLWGDFNSSALPTAQLIVGGITGTLGLFK